MSNQENTLSTEEHILVTEICGKADTFTKQELLRLSIDSLDDAVRYEGSRIGITNPTYALTKQEYSYCINTQSHRIIFYIRVEDDFYRKFKSLYKNELPEQIRST